MSKKILILTDSIAPPAYAPRVVSLCKYLHSQGWHCTVFSDRLPGVELFGNNDATWWQTQYYGNKQTISRYIADKIGNQREREFYNYIVSKVDIASFDCILCSSYYYFPLRTTQRLAKKYHIPYMVDLRDIAEQWGNIPYATTHIPGMSALSRIVSKLYETIQLKHRNIVLKDAQAVSTVSSWHQALLKHYNPQSHLIYNGFDEDEFTPCDITTSKFRISYTGKIYNTHLRDPRLAFQAVRELIDENRIDESKVEFVFHIDKQSQAEVQQVANEYNIGHLCHISGYIPKTALLSFMHQSSILLVLTCPSTPEGTHGIVGTKFYEALGVEKPVLCVQSDEECLAEIIGRTQAGLAATNVSQVKQFLLTKYEEWQCNGFTRQSVLAKEKLLFTRQFESAQFEHILLSIIASK